jgi:hypothetical protein
VSSDKKETNVYKRIVDLLSAILKSVVDGVRNPHQIAEALQAIVNTGAYLRQLFAEITVPATDGTESLTGLSASGYATPAMKATGWELILDGMFTQFFGSLGGKRRRWSNSQVAVFSRVNFDKLRGEGYGNFFELEDGSVARVDVNGGLPRADVYKFGNDLTWYAYYRRRVFSLQQVA